MEMVLALPFIWLVLVLVFNFGQAFLERQRTSVGLRELALRHSVVFDDSGENTPFNLIKDDLDRDTFARRRMSSAFFLDNGKAGTCPMPQSSSGPDQPPGQWDLADLLSGGVVDVLSGLLAKLSTSHSYEVESEGPATSGSSLPALFGGSVLAQPIHTQCLAVDTNSWTVHYTGTPAGWVTKMISSVIGAQ